MNRSFSGTIAAAAILCAVSVASDAFAAAPTLSASQTGSVVTASGTGYTPSGWVFAASYWWDGSTWESEGGTGWFQADGSGNFSNKEYAVGPKCNVWLCALGYDNSSTLWSNGDSCTWLYNPCPQ